ncbi:Z1 domain-containing protein [Kutzneria sp. NPDC052558]|uniref:Z1 domain-containing protein n=1 Tax=Kutzneria sp. NPDC052558 TaxID=3364121 RepID=UPI0037C94A36
MSDSLVESYLAALAAMKRGGPRDLHRKAASEAEYFEAGLKVGDGPLREHLATALPGDMLRRTLHICLADWDFLPAAVDWTEGTQPNTRERREVVLRRLDVDGETSRLFLKLFPVADADETVVIAKSWEPWYSRETLAERGFYWNHYSDYLLEKRGWAPEAVAKLDAATDHVVERLSEPTRDEAYQAKGLVVGYVQSGKTANFTGVVAKAIDVGYRLIIVLTGTTEVLRDQTQRRLDMELVGEENILRGISPSNHDALDAVDYYHTEDWANGKFVRHGRQPADLGSPDIHRMTTHKFDYRSLRQGISALDFERRDRTRPLYDPANLFTCDARLAIVKKNSMVLKKLVNDLDAITARLTDIPVLIIDDESDQASVNTSNPKKWESGKKERTSINFLISQLLRMLPRAQYVGYTATPFANVFVDPSDAEDIFPRDFLISLERPAGYMGADDFHDLDSEIPWNERTFENSKEKAHVRFVSDDKADDMLQEAIDAFVLTGAMKLYREDRGAPAYRHHTMLVHEGMKTDVHRDQALDIRRLWNQAGYFSPSGERRLRSLFENDILPVSEARASDDPRPKDYGELKDYVSRAVRRISPNGDPVIVVNSDQALEQEDLDFDQRSVWRILIGGNKLARGFTVEGLTVSYYLRATKQADTLMQMGRWFGFRRGYRDLVRLYVTPDLHEAFESICLDEDHFRQELRQYARPVDGGPQITPAEVPPLVASHMLKPTAAAKMYNAVLTQRRSPVKEPNRGYLDTREKAALAANVQAFEPILATLELGPGFPGRGGFSAWTGRVDHLTLLRVLAKLKWAHDDIFRADLAWLRTLGPELVRDWEVIMPQVKTTRTATLAGHGPFNLVERSAPEHRIRGNSTPSHRVPADAIAQADQSLTGGMLLYPMVDNEEKRSALTPEQDPDGVVMAFYLRVPSRAEPRDKRLVTFSTRDASKPAYLVLDE